MLTEIETIFAGVWCYEDEENKYRVMENGDRYTIYIWVGYAYKLRCSQRADGPRQALEQWLQGVN